MEEELVRLEQQVRRNDVEMEEEEFWQNEFQIEQDNEQQLRQQLVELQGRVRDCEARLAEYLTHIQVSPVCLMHTRVCKHLHIYISDISMCCAAQSMEKNLEQERQQHEAELNQKVNEEEVQKTY